MKDNNIEICPDCGVQRINGDFHWSYALQIEKTNPHKPSKPVLPDEVYSKVCGLAKRVGRGKNCINSDASFNASLTYDELPQSYIDELKSN